MRNIKKEFYDTNAWGLLTSVDLYKCNPKTIRDARAIKRYVDELCELIEMKQFEETQIVNFGEDEKVAGFSMVQLIETSLISGHFANKTNNAYIDIFSCKYYEPSVAVKFTKKFFEAKEVKMHYILRS
jgi:S-adenosylmethionine/arginine decarboxylase-like enzyme